MVRGELNNDQADNGLFLRSKRQIVFGSHVHSHNLTVFGDEQNDCTDMHSFLHSRYI